jgi:epoxide hydrolase-like predicted phosphatase
MAIKAVIFDFGGVLTTNITSRFTYALYRGTKYHRKPEPKAFLNILHKFSKGKISEREFFEKTSKIIGKDEKKIRDVWQGILHKSKYRKEMFILIEKLRENGYKVAVLSNTNPTHQQHYSKRGDYDHFHVKILSNLVGYRKPSKAIYKLALRKLKIRPEEAVFIDDLKRNILPARRIGINVIYYKNYRQVFNDLRKLGVKF